MGTWIGHIAPGRTFADLSSLLILAFQGRSSSSLPFGGMRIIVCGISERREHASTRSVHERWFDFEVRRRIHAFAKDCNTYLWRASWRFSSPPFILPSRSSLDTMVDRDRISAMRTRITRQCSSASFSARGLRSWFITAFLFQLVSIRWWDAWLLPSKVWWWSFIFMLEIWSMGTSINCSVSRWSVQCSQQWPNVSIRITSGSLLLEASSPWRKALGSFKLPSSSGRSQPIRTSSGILSRTDPCRYWPCAMPII